MKISRGKVFHFPIDRLDITLGLFSGIYSKKKRDSIKNRKWFIGGMYETRYKLIKEHLFKEPSSFFISYFPFR